MAMPMDRLIRCVICLALLLPSAELLADWREALPDAHLQGSGEMRMFGFSIYNARFWSPRQPLGADTPFALELTYSRAISRDDLVEASLKEIRRLTPGSLSPELAARWEREMQQACRCAPWRSHHRCVYAGRGRTFLRRRHVAACGQG